MPHSFMIRATSSRIYIKCADDTYVLADSPDALSCAISVLSHKLAKVGQVLAPKKCEVLAETGVSLVVRVWSQEEIAEFAGSRRPPEATLASRPSMPSSPSLLVLGTQFSMEPSQQTGLDHRIQAAWKSFHQVKHN